MNTDIFMLVHSWFPVPVIVFSLLMCLIHLLCCSVAKSCLNLNESVNWSTPGSSVHHDLPEFAQINAIETVMLSNMASSAAPFSCVYSLSQHQSLF